MTMRLLIEYSEWRKRYVSLNIASVRSAYTIAGNKDHDRRHWQNRLWVRFRMPCFQESIHWVDARCPRMVEEPAVHQPLPPLQSATSTRHEILSVYDDKVHRQDLGRQIRF